MGTSVDAHIIAWNEAETIALTIRHYQSFCRRIFIYDNHSDDDTVKISLSMGCTVRVFGHKGVLDDREYTHLKNNCWKGSDADFVIVVDADEILFPPVWDSKITIYKTYGWNVHAHELPEVQWLEITKGVHDPNYSKLCCFNPRQITEIGYVHGAHVAKPKGNIVYSDQAQPLFHYRNVGGPERLVKRHALYRERLSDWNKYWKCGDHYNHEDERRIKEWEERFERSTEYYQPGS